MPLGSPERPSANNSALWQELGLPLWRLLAAEMLREKVIADVQGDCYVYTPALLSPAAA